MSMTAVCRPGWQHWKGAFEDRHEGSLQRGRSAGAAGRPSERPRCCRGPLEKHIVSLRSVENQVHLSFPRRRESTSWAPACAGVTGTGCSFSWVGRRPMIQSEWRFGVFTGCKPQ